MLPGCIATLRLLAVTGMRLGEVLWLEWDHIDLGAGVLRLPDAKSGARTIPLGAPARALLASLSRSGAFVVHGPDPAKPLSVHTLQKA